MPFIYWSVESTAGKGSIANLSPLEYTKPLGLLLTNAVQQSSRSGPPLTVELDLLLDFPDTFFGGFPTVGVGTGVDPMFRFLPRRTGMNRYLPLLALVAGMSLIIGACVIGDRQPKTLPVQVTCRELRDHPANYVGRKVLVSTKGTEVMDGKLVWRLYNPGDPDVVFYFPSGGIPDPLPSEIVGDCLAPVRDGPVRIINCE